MFRNALCLAAGHVDDHITFERMLSMALSAAQLKHFEKRLRDERAALQQELQRYTSAEAADV